MSGSVSLLKSAMIAPWVRVFSEIPASAALSTALTGIPAEVDATDALKPEASVDIEIGCCGAWAELSLGAPLPSCAGAAAAELPDGQMVSTSADRPTAHTCEVSGAFATSSIALSSVPALEIALGKALQLEPSQWWVVAT